MLAPERHHEEQPSNIVPLPGQASSRRRRGRWLALALVLVVAAGVAVVLTRGGTSGIGTARELRRTVEVRSGDGAFESVRTHPKVIAGDLVRTGRRGRGQIDYGDGSITRLDSKTIFEVKELTTAGKRVVRSELTRGRIWNNVRKLASVEDRFEVRTPNAVATVRGTIFMVEVVPNGRGGTNTTVAQVTGQTDVTFGGNTVSLTAAGCTTNGGPCRYSPEELASMPFMKRYSSQDNVALPWASKPATDAADPNSTKPASSGTGAGSSEGAGESEPTETDTDDGRRGTDETRPDSDDDDSTGRGGSETRVSDSGGDTSNSSNDDDEGDSSGGGSGGGSGDSGGSDSGGSDSGGGDSGGGESFSGDGEDGGGSGSSSKNKNDGRDGRDPDGDAGRGNDDR